MSRTGRTFVVGRITNGERKGWTWLGIQDPAERSYDRLVAPLSGDVTHALVIGDADDVREMIRLLQNQIGEEDE